MTNIEKLIDLVQKLRDALALDEAELNSGQDESSPEIRSLLTRADAALADRNSQNYGTVPESDLTGCDKDAEDKLSESAAIQRDYDNGRAEVRHE